MLASLARLLRTAPAVTLPAPERRGPPLIVLGMHRSGTSFLTGTLQLAGLELGPHNTSAKHNQKGNRENPEIVAFHDAVLAARGTSWRAPPPEQIRWTTEEEARARALVATYEGTPRWGFKDPRSLAMIDEWRRICPGAGLIGIFRNPVSVTRSLLQRGMAINEPECWALWRHSNEVLLRLHESEPFPLFSFDDSARVLHRKLGRILSDYGLAPLGRETFFSADLKHHKDPRDPVPTDLLPLYRALQARQC